ncbi:MAG: LytR/AlgR family response regulator transcription factor [Sphingomicrobium sp.]
MTLLRTLLVDDEPLALERLEFLLRDVGSVEVAGTASNGREAAEQIAALKPDLVFLDVQMPEQNGLRVASTLDPEDRPEIIFVTAFEHYAADAFEVEAADYLLKPVRFDRLWQAVERAKRRKYLRELAGREGEPDSSSEAVAEGKSEHEDGFWVQTRSGAVFVPSETIDWIEAQRDYVMLHTATRSHMIRMSMRSLEDKLDPAQLTRVHRSAFARPSNVVEVQRLGRTINALVMRDGAIIQVGPSYARGVAERLKLRD